MLWHPSIPASQQVSSDATRLPGIIVVVVSSSALQYKLTIKQTRNTSQQERDTTSCSGTSYVDRRNLTQLVHPIVGKLFISETCVQHHNQRRVVSPHTQLIIHLYRPAVICTITVLNAPRNPNVHDSKAPHSSA